jgi:hypothetical protein
MMYKTICASGIPKEGVFPTWSWLRIGQMKFRAFRD